MKANRYSVLACVLIAAACSSSPPSPLVNGDFETGDLEGWTTEAFSNGEWLIYEDGTVPPNPLISDKAVPFDMADPPQGRYAAVTDQNGMGIGFYTETSR